MIVIDSLRPDDRPTWEALFRAYMQFYERDAEPQAMYDRAWDEFVRDDRMHARAARLDGRMVGFVHFLVHANTSSADVCYLQDLFTADDVRGRGIATALIDAVVEWATEQGCARVYWLTKYDNVVARSLYDKLAINRGFIRYDIPIVSGK